MFQCRENDHRRKAKNNSVNCFQWLPLAAMSTKRNFTAFLHTVFLYAWHKQSGGMWVQVGQSVETFLWHICEHRFPDGRNKDLKQKTCLFLWICDKFIYLFLRLPLGFSACSSGAMMTSQLCMQWPVLWP